MSRIDDMIQRLCPDGVEYKKLGEVAEIIEQKGELPPEYAQFKLIFEEAKEIYGASPKAGAWAAIQRELGSICYRILGNTAVFKDKELTVKFMEELGFKTV